MYSSTMAAIAASGGVSMLVSKLGRSKPSSVGAMPASEIGEKSLVFRAEWFHVAHLLLCIAVDELADRRRGSQSTQRTATSRADAADRHVELLADLGVAQGRVGGQQREQSAI